MSSISRAMLWELWRLSRMELLGRIGYSSSIIVFLVMGVMASGKEMPSSFLASIALVVVSMSAIFSSAWLKIDSMGQGFDVRLSFTRPVSTRHLVLGRLTYFAATSMLCYLVPAVLFQMLSGMELNLSSPLVVICSFVICATCAGWSSSTAVSQVVGIVGVCGGFIVAAIAFCTSRLGEDPLLFSLGQPEFMTLDWYQIVLLILVAGGSIRICLSSVESQRHGERIRFGWKLTDANVLQSSSGAVSSSYVVASPAFHAAGIPPWKARLWRHWRQSGKLVLLIAVVLAIAVAALVTIVQLDKPRWTGGPAFWMGALVLSPIVYQIIAAELTLGLKRIPGMIELSTYDAVQPVRDDTTIATILGSIVAMSAVGWMLMAAAATGQTIWAGNFSAWLQMGETVGLQLNGVAWYDVLHSIAALVSLFVIGSAGMLTFGLLVSLWKDWHMGAGTIVFLLLFCTGALDLHYKWEIDWFWSSVKIIFGIAAASAFGYGIFLCVVRRPFGVPYGIFVVVTSVTALTAIIRLFLSGVEFVPVPLSTTYMVLGGVNLSAGIVATLCLPPLALNLHRHR